MEKTLQQKSIFSQVRMQRRRGKQVISRLLTENDAGRRFMQAAAIQMLRNSLFAGIPCETAKNVI